MKDKQEPTTAQKAIFYLFSVLFTTILFAMAWLRSYNYGAYPKPFTLPYSLVLIAAFAFFYFIFIRRHTTLWLILESFKDIVYSQIFSALIADGIFYVIITLLLRSLPNIPLMLMTLVVQAIVETLWALCFREMFRRTDPM